MPNVLSRQNAPFTLLVVTSKAEFWNPGEEESRMVWGRTVELWRGIPSADQDASTVRETARVEAKKASFDSEAALGEDPNFRRRRHYTIHHLLRRHEKCIPRRTLAAASSTLLHTTSASSTLLHTSSSSPHPRKNAPTSPSCSYACNELAQASRSSAYWKGSHLVIWTIWHSSHLPRYKIIKTCYCGRAGPVLSGILLFPK